ncbi:MAG: hypothetical protein HYY24_20415 [Verrucomicrobia bacterium]|nr:hypothetical protein [Verrucomicrobiota bacterium]
MTAVIGYVLNRFSEDGSTKWEAVPVDQVIPRLADLARRAELARTPDRTILFRRVSDGGRIWLERMYGPGAETANGGAAKVGAITNRAFTPARDGWIQVTPLGEFPHSDGIVQVIDAEAARRVANSFSQDARRPNFAGLLVDFDHFSYDTGKSSQAAGWIVGLQNRGDGLWARVDWSERGEAAVKAGEFRFVSPVWRAADLQQLGNNRVRPLRLDSVALTNVPNMRGGMPIST